MPCPCKTVAPHSSAGWNHCQPRRTNWSRRRAIRLRDRRRDANSMRAIVYARTATKVRTESRRSIKRRIADARQYARANGFEVAKIFTDAGFSGTRLDRPALNKMCALIARDSIDVVIVQDLSRFTRSVTDHMVLQREFAKRGTQLCSVADENRPQI